MFLTNRDVIKNLKINTGTTSSPVFTLMCQETELTLGMDFEEQTWYDFCNAFQKALKTGVAITIEGTVKIDITNDAIKNVLGDVHTLLASGEIAQFNNKLIQFDLVTGVNNGVIEYTTYQADVAFSLENLGGAAEDVGEFAMSMTVNSASVVTSA